MHLIMALAAVFAISWIVSTAEDRAAAGPAVNYWGKVALAAEAIVIAAVWLWERLR